MTERYKLEQYGRRLEQLIKENTRISVCSVHCARTHTWPLLYYVQSNLYHLYFINFRFIVRHYISSAGDFELKIFSIRH